VLRECIGRSGLDRVILPWPLQRRTIGTLLVSCLWFCAVGQGAAGAAETRQQTSSNAARMRKPSARHLPVRGGLTEIAVDLPSLATGGPVGTLALRVDFPEAPRYAEGAPVVIWVHGGYEEGRLQLELQPPADDLIVINFLFPGGAFEQGGRRSDGVYDYRGLASILALRDVILYAAGRLADNQNRTIDDVVPVRVLHDNIGLVGKSNSGNILAAVVALHGDELAGNLRYLIQWESPVSSQVATRDLGRPLLDPEGPNQGEYSNPRYLGYGAAEFSVDFSDLAQDPSGALYRVFHDGNGDGRYTTVARPGDGAPVPDLDLDGELELDEDFPLDTYPMADGTACYSRPVTRELAQRELFGGEWPDGIATPAEAIAFWDLREAVLLLPIALDEMPLLEGMILASVRDHVQARLDKPHLRQAFEAWRSNGGWVQINPDPAYLIAVDPELGGRGDLPANTPNTPPASWEHPASYCVPEDIPDPDYLLAAVWQMADRAAATSR
jgi:hypothetical protein